MPYTLKCCFFGLEEAERRIWPSLPAPQQLGAISLSTIPTATWVGVAALFGLSILLHRRASKRHFGLGSPDRYCAEFFAYDPHHPQKGEWRRVGRGDEGCFATREEAASAARQSAGQKARIAVKGCPAPWSLRVGTWVPTECKGVRYEAP